MAPLVGTKFRVGREDMGDVAGAVRRSLDASLGRLGLERVDLLQLHNPLAAAAEPRRVTGREVLEQVVPALHDLQRAGKIRFYGITALGDTGTLHQVIDAGVLDTAQVCYNLLNPSAGAPMPAGLPAQDFNALLPRLSGRGAGAIVIRVLAGGALSGVEERHPVAVPDGRADLVGPRLRDGRAARAPLRGAREGRSRRERGRGRAPFPLGSACRVHRAPRVLEPRAPRVRRGRHGEGPAPARGPRPPRGRLARAGRRRLTGRRAAGSQMAFDGASLLEHWGYAAVFGVVILGNVGLPIPEETVLLLAGYLVWEGQLRLPWVLAVGISAAVVGDSLGYWLGRRIGPRIFERHGHHVGLTPARLERLQAFVRRRGAWAVFVARFVPGLRSTAGPIAGMLGLPLSTFAVANLAGAVVYVPLAVGAGYGLSHALGPLLVRFEQSVAQVEHVLLVPVVLAPVALVAWRRWLRPHAR